MLSAFWKKKIQYALPNGKRIVRNNTQEKLILLHIDQFIAHFNNDALQKASSLQLRRWIVLSGWTNLSILCQLMPNSCFSNLSNSEINNFLLGEGICTGTVIHYFNQFFQTHSPTKSSPFPLALNAIMSVKNRAEFYLFKSDKAFLEKQTDRLRFLQASYKLAYELKPTHSLEFLSTGILKNANIEIVQRIPDSQELGKNAFSIQELIFQLKQLAQNQNDRGYLLGVSGATTHHALGLYLQAPFHFLDPGQGIGIANRLEDLILFLASYLTERYSQCVSFALLAFEPQNSKTEKGREEEVAVGDLY